MKLSLMKDNKWYSIKIGRIKLFGFGKDLKRDLPKMAEIKKNIDDFLIWGK